MCPYYVPSLIWLSSEGTGISLYILRKQWPDEINTPFISRSDIFKWISCLGFTLLDGNTAGYELKATYPSLVSSVCQCLSPLTVMSVVKKQFVFCYCYFNNNKFHPLTISKSRLQFMIVILGTISFTPADKSMLFLSRPFHSIGELSIQGKELLMLLYFATFQDWTQFTRICQHILNGSSSRKNF